MMKQTNRQTDRHTDNKSGKKHRQRDRARRECKLINLSFEIKILLITKEKRDIKLNEAKLKRFETK